MENQDTDFCSYEKPIVGMFIKVKHELSFLELMESSIWVEFVASEEWAQFCQWKCVELSAVISIDSFANFSLVGGSQWGDVYRATKRESRMSTF